MIEAKPQRPLILFVDQLADLGGAQHALLDLLPGLAEAYVPVVASPGAGPFSAELQRRGVHWEPLALGHYRAGKKSSAEILGYALRQPALVARLVQLARRAGAALLYANGPRVFPATALAARRLRIPLLWHLQLELTAARDRRLVAAAARVGHPAIIACSRACLLPFSARSLLRRSAQVIYNGVPPLQWTPAEARFGNSPAIGVVGRLHPDKAQGDLLRSAPQILAAYPEARFRLVGAVADESYARALREQATAWAPGRVEFTGPLPSPAQALAGLDLLVVPSRREALGRVILEAFSAGIPVLGSDAGGIPEVIEPGHNGLLFPCGNADELARGVLQMLADRSLRAALTRGARESYERRWNLERFREEVLGQIARQIAPQPPGR